MDLSKCFKALSDKTRLRLLYVLSKYELNVNEIVLVVDMIQSGVSRHLRILLEAGLLVSRKEGSYIYYSADAEGAGRGQQIPGLSRVNLQSHCLDNEPHGDQEDPGGDVRQQNRPHVVPACRPGRHYGR